MSENTIKITKGNYDTEVKTSSIPVLIDFWATWCGPCRMMTPVVDELADEATGRYKVGKVNVDEEPELANAFAVNAIPTFVAIRDGEVMSTAVGVKQKGDLLAMLGL